MNPQGSPGVPRTPQDSPGFPRSLQESPGVTRIPQESPGVPGTVRLSEFPGIAFRTRVVQRAAAELVKKNAPGEKHATGSNEWRQTARATLANN